MNIQDPKPTILPTQENKKVGTYIYHRDRAYQCWNVFEVISGEAFYKCSFDELKDAQDYCRIANGE